MPFLAFKPTLFPLQTISWRSSCHDLVSSFLRNHICFPAAVCPRAYSIRYLISPGLRPRPPSGRRSLGLGFQQDTCSQSQKPMSQGLWPNLRCLTDVPAAQPPVHTHPHIVYKLIHCLNCTTHTSTYCINSLTHVHTLPYITHHIHTYTYTHPINHTHYINYITHTFLSYFSG